MAPSCRKSNRLSILLLAATISWLFQIGNASATGWWQENLNDTINVLAQNGASTADNGLWSTQRTNPTLGYSYNTPHQNFTTTSNRCKTCHAVHGALSQSYRLLRNVGRLEECNYCHMGPAGASKLRLYALQDIGYTVQGEHTLGSSDVPDSNINGGARGIGNLPDRGGPYDSGGRQALYCYSCHSVHGARVITGGSWREKILRNDPAKNGGDANDGLQDGIFGRTFIREDGVTLDMDVMMFETDYSEGGGYYSAEEIKKAYCGDCHNKNYNFRVNMPNLDGEGTVKDLFGNGDEEEGKDYSLNKTTHPMNDNQMLHVSGGAGKIGVIEVSQAGRNVLWCGDCHSAAGSENEYGLKSAGTFGDPWSQSWKVVGFPHQSRGPKFFGSGYDLAGAPPRDATQTNDAYDPIPNMDNAICMQCHLTSDGGPGAGF